MRLARSLALLAALAALVTVLAACAAESTPGWTFSPTPTPTAAPSGEPGSTSAPGTPAPSGAATAAPSDGGAGGATVTLKLTAAGIAYDTDTLEVPANTPFKIEFTNNDAGIPHNVAIHEGSPTGTVVWTGDIFNGVETRTYDVPALPAGTYGFVCTVHPNMTGTLTAK
jgi:plastocyanin